MSEKSYINRNDIAYKVKDLSGDFFEPMDDCLNLMKSDRPTQYETIYFGDPKEIEDGGKYHWFKRLAMLERYRFKVTGETSGFYYVTDPECMKAFKLDVTQNYIGTFTAEKKGAVIVLLKED